jgi:hypothetical protein
MNKRSVAQNERGIEKFWSLSLLIRDLYVPLTMKKVKNGRCSQCQSNCPQRHHNTQPLDVQSQVVDGVGRVLGLTLQLVSQLTPPTQTEEDTDSECRYDKLQASRKSHFFAVSCLLY